MSFKPNCNYYFQLSYKKEVDPYFKLKIIDKLLIELKELIIIYYKNLYSIQKFQKPIYNKGVKPKNYISGNKIQLNNKYINTKYS